MGEAQGTDFGLVFDFFEGMLQKILDGLVHNSGLFAETALLDTFDEGGGYWDSGTFVPSTSSAKIRAFR